MSQHRVVTFSDLVSQIDFYMLRLNWDLGREYVWTTIVEINGLEQFDSCNTQAVIEAIDYLCKIRRITSVNQRKYGKDYRRLDHNSYEPAPRSQLLGELYKYAAPRLVDAVTGAVVYKWDLLNFDRIVMMTQPWCGRNRELSSVLSLLTASLHDYLRDKDFIEFIDMRFTGFVQAKTVLFSSKVSPSELADSITAWATLISLSFETLVADFATRFNGTNMFNGLGRYNGFGHVYAGSVFHPEAYARATAFSPNNFSCN